MEQESKEKLQLGHEKGSSGYKLVYKKTVILKACPVACGVCCADDPTYVFETDREEYPAQNCAWIAKKFEARKRYCDKKMIKAACPLTCDNCQDPIVADDDAGVDDD